jgi:hypothetical protein
VAGAGLLLYLLLDEHATYATQVLPGAFVFGLGLAMTVAPLTATVLAAAGTGDAGVASGINNAIARVAGLLAIAVVGAVVAARYDAVLGHHAKALVATDPATAHASVSALHTGLLVSALLVIAGGLTALAGIENPPREPEAAT